MTPPVPLESRRGARRYADLAIGLGFASVAFAGSLRVSAEFPPIIYEYRNELPGGGQLTTFNLWFDADFPKIMRMVWDRHASYPGFTAKHPLQRPIVHGAVFTLKRLGLDPVDGLRVFAALGAALWAAALYTVLRLISARRLDAMCFTALGLSSASAMFWLIGPESFTLGAVSILVPLGAAALAERRALSATAYVCAGAVSLAITVTNWMAGLFLVFFAHPWRRALQYSANAFVIVSILWSMQKVLIPSAEFFLAAAQYDQQFFFDPGSGGPLRVLASFVSHSMVMPAIQVRARSDPMWYGMFTQMSAPGSAGMWGTLAVVLWLALLGIGVYAVVTTRRLTLFRRVLVATVLGQAVLHLVYGHETFLYSLHFLPLLVAVAALGTLTRWRGPVLATTAVLVVANAINNTQQLRTAVHTVQRVASLTDAPP